MRGGATGRRITAVLIMVLLIGGNELTGSATAGAAQRTASAAPEVSADGCPGRKARTLRFSTGQVRIYRSGTQRCAVTLAKRPGTRRQMSVSIQARGGRPRTDSGRFTRRAGPVRITAGHRCVLVRGSVGGASASSGWTLC